MSAESVKEFFAKVEQDKGLQKKVKTIHKKSDDAMKAATKGLLAVAKSAGFKFTAKDLAEARSSKGSGGKGQVRAVAAQNDCGYGVNYWCNAAWQCGYGVYH